jgi:cyclopropane fatty-acyl-phospholipid synthase-like methyltransferase
MTSSMNQSPMWDARYSTDEYVFGTEPAAFLTNHSVLLTAGTSALAVADGEGRNAVYLAEQGLDVTTMDISPVGVEKARRLATERGVEVDIRVADVLDWDWSNESYDLVVAVFIQFLTPEQRPDVFDGMVAALRPGGRLMLHGYRPEQVDNGTGGPPNRDHMYTDALLRESFAGMQIEQLHSYDAVLEEGAGHRGESALIDLIATKP